LQSFTVKKFEKETCPQKTNQDKNDRCFGGVDFERLLYRDATTLQGDNE
jgi:hypothetical protein